MAKKGIKGYVLAVALFLPILLVLVLVVMVVLPSVIVTPRSYSDPYQLYNSRWTCREVDVNFIMDQSQDCYGIVNGGEEYLYIEFAHSTGGYRDNGFCIYRLNGQTLEEAVAQNRGTLLLEGKLLGCDGNGLSFRLTKKDLPLWGVDKPTMLHFDREELSESIDFREKHVSIQTAD